MGNDILNKSMSLLSFNEIKKEKSNSNFYVYITEPYYEISVMKIYRVSKIETGVNGGLVFESLY
jgi:hypothetical protein